MDKRLILLGVVVIVAAVVVAIPSQDQPATVRFLTDPLVDVQVEIAQSPEELQQGLMHRESLGEQEGMLFLFGTEQPLDFWMKNTLIPLDIIFVNSEFEIVSVRTAVPCEADPCPLYSSGRAAQYVVEVNAGFAEDQGIHIGDRIELRI